MAFPHEVDGPLVDQYRGGGDQEPEAVEPHAPGQTLSWDPVRDDRLHLVVKEPEDSPPVSRP